MIFAANFKTNHTRATTKAYIKILKEKLLAKKSQDRVYIFPPSTALDSYSGDFTIGTQNSKCILKILSFYSSIFEVVKNF